MSKGLITRLGLPIALVGALAACQTTGGGNDMPQPKDVLKNYTIVDATGANVGSVYDVFRLSISASFGNSLAGNWSNDIKLEDTELTAKGLDYYTPMDLDGSRKVSQTEYQKSIMDKLVGIKGGFYMLGPNGERIEGDKMLEVLALSPKEFAREWDQHQNANPHDYDDFWKPGAEGGGDNDSSDSSTGGNTGGGDTGCFVAGVMVTMADGSQKRIEDVKVGEYVLGLGGSVNQVEVLFSPKLGNRQLYGINGSVPFVTSGHPFATDDSDGDLWESIDPEATKREGVGVKVGKLESNLDNILMASGSNMPVLKIEGIKADANMQLYNFAVGGNQSYIVNGMVVHNKGTGAGGSGGAGGGD